MTVRKTEFFDQFVALSAMLQVKQPNLDLTSVYLAAALKTLPGNMSNVAEANIKIQSDSSLKSIFDSYWDVCL
ncbi:hypothetical protein SJ_48 [Proteus phage SJ_PmiM]|nr:hypothetical protein SJ_48 [Proteus phage SJ_PmiM]